VRAVAGQRVGYRRVSTVDQSPARQLDGVQVDRTYTDHASGSTTRRDQMDELRRFVRDGDTVVVHSMDRLARNVDDLRALVREFTGQGVAVQFVTERMTFTGDDSPMQELMLNLLGSVAAFERALIRERQAEGIAAAKRRGVYKGRARTLSAEQAAELREKAAAGVPKAQLARQFGIHRATVYHYLQDVGAASAAGGGSGG
jgi:DNA invertase Pin-like site-specific DNA recombinase